MKKLAHGKAHGKAHDAVARSDLRWVIAGTLLTFAIASAFELQEKLAALAQRYEAWEVDELLLTLLALLVGLAWYARRRRIEATRLLAHNRELAQQLIALQESERRAIARELHDELAQHCTAIRIEAAYIQRADDPAQIIAAAQRSADTAELLYEGVRRLLRRLRPAELDALGLVAALQSLCSACTERGDAACRLIVAGDPDALGEAMDTAVYRIVQEALSNAMRHARAAHIEVRLACGGAVEVVIDDDGCGFEPTTRTHGLGLLGSTERAAALGGTLTVDSAPGAGTRVCVRLPRADRAAAASSPPSAATTEQAA